MERWAFYTSRPNGVEKTEVVELLPDVDDQLFLDHGLVMIRFLNGKSTFTSTKNVVETTKEVADIFIQSQRSSKHGLI